MAKKLFSKENQPPGERKSVPKFRTLMLNALKERGIDEKGFVECGYCDKRFVLVGGPADDQAH